MRYSIAAAAIAFVAGSSATYNASVTYVTDTVTAYTTYCPVATTISHGNMTYTATAVRVNQSLSFCQPLRRVWLAFTPLSKPFGRAWLSFPSQSLNTLKIYPPIHPANPLSPQSETVTITNCPCTISYPVTTTSITSCPPTSTPAPTYANTTVVASTNAPSPSAPSASAAPSSTAPITPSNAGKLMLNSGAALAGLVALAAFAL